jgi:hypothetical protein
MAFDCVGCVTAPTVRDFDGIRHWTRVDGQFRRLSSLPRQNGKLRTVQFYRVQDGPPATAAPWVQGFEATPDVELENWLAMVSRDGKRLVATVSRPALFLFHNLENPCIHSCPSLGALQHGETGRALTRLYFVEASLEDWYARMKRELAP